MNISGRASRLTAYYDRNGFWATARRSVQAVRRALSSNYMVLFYCDLPPKNSWRVELPSSLNVERKRNATELDPQDLRQIAEFWNPKLALRSMRERFGQGAWLWIMKSEGKLAGWGWTLQGQTIEPHYFRLGPDDVHLFDFLVLPEFRGRGINPMLVNYILGNLAAGCTGRAFIEAAEWNRAQLSSLKKTPFRRIGCARKLTVCQRTIVCWAPDETSKQALTLGLAMTSDRKYAIISPVRDEEAYLKQTIESVLAQSVLPAEWVIVNDGSKDRTGEIVDEYAGQYPWIRAVHRVNRGYRKSGAGVMEAFNDGYAALGCRDWEFIVKLDGDLSFERDYFEKCFGYFEREPRLGVGGGVIYNLMPDGTQKFERGGPDFHVRGATKIYRRACWEDIGGLWLGTGWDTLDEVKANMHGWPTRNFPDVHLVQHRATGAADGRWGDLVKNGKANYISGYHPLFMLAKCVSRLRRRPYLVGSVALAYGFITGYWKRIRRFDDPAVIRYLRGQQLRKLAGMETIWK